MKRICSSSTAAIIAAALTAPLCAPVQAGGIENIIVVTTTVDTLDAFDQKCSLREAIANANNDNAFSPVVNECAAGIANGTDVIRLASGATYPLSLSGAGDEGGDLDILDGADLPEDVRHLRIEVTGGAAPATLSQTAAGERVMENKGAALELRDVVLRNGSLAAPGGGLYSVAGRLWLTRVGMFSNSATFGGGLFNFGRASIVDSSIQLNTASAGGGGLFNAGDHTVDLFNVSVRGNTAMNGGGINSAAGIVLVEGHSVINLNSASGDGGGIAIYQPGGLFVREATFEGNQATQSGGAVYTTSTSSTPLLRSSFVNNQAAFGGAVRGLVTSDIRAFLTRFESNTASSNGGAIHAVFATLGDAEFTANQAGGSGGALHIVTSAEGENVDFTGNKAHTGGAIQAQIYVQTGGVFRDNLATTGTGGGINYTNFIELDQVRFLFNGALKDGGALHSTQAGALASNVARGEFTNNVASGNGGAIYSRGVLNLANTTISGNAAGGDAGGLYIREGSSVRAINVTIAFNQLGGDLYKYGDLTMRNSIISTPGQPDCVVLLENPDIQSLGNNISDDTSCEGLDEPTDKQSVNPLLLPLAADDGNSRTHALQANSPAIDAGDLAACLAIPVGGIDQRGGMRPAGNGCDIGAHEQGAQLPAAIFADGFEGI